MVNLIAAITPKARVYANGSALLCLIIASATLGAEAVSENPDSTRETGSESAPSPGFVDRAHAAISRNLSASATHLDALFGENALDEETNQSSLRLRPKLDWEQASGTDLSLPLRVYLSLPNLEDRWQAFIASDSGDDELDSEFPFSQSTPLTEDDRIDERRSQLGISYIDTAKENRDLRYSLGARIRGADIDPYFQVRTRNSQDLGSWKGRLINKFYYFFELGGEISLRADLDRALNENGLFRATSQVNWIEDEEGLQLSQAFTRRQLLSDRSAAAFGYQLRAETEPTMLIRSHTLFVEYRRQFWRDWLYYQISPQLRFREEFDYKAHPALVLSLDIHFRDE